MAPKKPILQKLRHLQNIFKRLLPLLYKPKFKSMIADNRQYFKIQFWCKVTLTFPLFFSKILTLLQAGEIDEPQIKRSLYFLGPFNCEQQVGDVDLLQSNRLSQRMRISISLCMQKLFDYFSNFFIGRHSYLEKFVLDFL